MFDTLPAPAHETAGAFAERAMQYGSTAATSLGDSPIEPTWILDGSPVARALNLTEAHDKNLSCGLWDCTAGSFKWIFRCDEIVHILEGEVIVQDDAGARTLRPGDIAFFPHGLETVWRVPHYVKKFAIHRSVERGFVTRVASKVKKVIARAIQVARAAVM